MNYDKMSDYQINKRVFPHTSNFGKCEDVQSKPNPNRSCFMWGDGCNWFAFNPCNNPSDAWPIITENHINLSKHKDDNEWFAFVRADGLGVSEFQCKDKNPLRASMICFLKMKDAEKC